MTKFGQAEYNDFMARIFADKLDKLLKESEKQNYINRNTKNLRRQKTQLKEKLRCQDLLSEYLSAELLECLQCVCAEQPQKPTNVWISQIRTDNFIEFGD